MNAPHSGQLDNQWDEQCQEDCQEDCQEEWWTAARFCSPLAVSELEIPDVMVARLQFATRSLRAGMSPDTHWNVQLPQGGELVGTQHESGLPEFRLAWFTRFGRGRLGIDVIPDEFVHPLDARRLSQMGWPKPWGAAVPWIRRRDGSLQNPMVEDVRDLLGALQWMRYRASVQSTAARQIA